MTPLQQKISVGRFYEFKCEKPRMNSQIKGVSLSSEAGRWSSKVKGGGGDQFHLSNISQFQWLMKYWFLIYFAQHMNNPYLKQPYTMFSVAVLMTNWQIVFLSLYSCLLHAKSLWINLADFHVPTILLNVCPYFMLFGQTVFSYQWPFS